MNKILERIKEADELEIEKIKAELLLNIAVILRNIEKKRLIYK